MSLTEVLRAKSSEYELVAEWHGERAPLDDQHLVAYQAMLVVGIVLREVAEAIEVGWGRKRMPAEAACSRKRPTLMRAPVVLSRGRAVRRRRREAPDPTDARAGCSVSRSPPTGASGHASYHRETH
jgi:hypothetical protein